MYKVSCLINTLKSSRIIRNFRGSTGLSEAEPGHDGGERVDVLGRAFRIGDSLCPKMLWILNALKYSNPYLIWPQL